MNVTVGRTFHFDAAHRLNDYDGPCAEIHGHTWHVTVEVSGEPGSNGILIDLKDLKDEVEDILSELDHKYLNYCIAFLSENPTCEYLAYYLMERLALRLGDKTRKVTKVKVQEGEGGYAYVTKR